MHCAPLLACLSLDQRHAWSNPLFCHDKQLAVVRQFTDLIAAAAGDPSLTGRTRVLLTEAPDGGWGWPATRTRTRNW